MNTGRHRICRRTSPVLRYCFFFILFCPPSPPPCSRGYECTVDRAGGDGEGQQTARLGQAGWRADGLAGEGLAGEGDEEGRKLLQYSLFFFFFLFFPFLFFQVRPTTDGKGLGLFAINDTPKDTFIGEYFGRILLKVAELHKSKSILTLNGFVFFNSYKCLCLQYTVTVLQINNTVMYISPRRTFIVCPLYRCCK